MLIIDRFEGDIAVIENGDEMIDIPRLLLPENAKEGDVIIQSGGGYIVDSGSAEKRRQEMLDLQDSLWEQG